MGDPGHDKCKCRNEKLSRCVEELNGYFQTREMTLGERNEREEVLVSKGINEFYFCFRCAMTSYYLSPKKSKALP